MAVASIRWGLSLCLLAALAAPAAAQATWIVDAAGGAGASFTSLPAAVSAGATGDTLVIRAGSYEGFSTGKGLTLLGEGLVQVLQTPVFRGFPLALQAADASLTTPLTLSNPAVVIIQ